ncbi:GWT1-domain-containing protein [Hygrophoropsis aurantiaca]|uniref:GWT1-domain-containing protein n=1 Tax=Hygrophoropsis aurantiaca TaxID=72124 RepID=A0ACB8AR06_9AGAM|nr:GWT1-domain-containing protein [Hygrophoropsis aurantiaca]
MDSTYKASKEAFVSSTTGSTIRHVNMISAVALASIALHSALRSRIQSLKSMPFVVEWLILVTPLLLSMTVFAEAPGALSMLLLAPTLTLLFVPPLERGSPLPSRNVDEPTSLTPKTTPTASLKPVPALTTYRAHMLLMTMLSILAVDFPVFPRFLAKCETFGVSLMDLGVGSFVFSQGVVSAIPVIKDPSHLRAPLVPKLTAVTRKMLPIIALGIVRVLLVKGTEYPEHVTEYGTHWNFFITLAILPIIQTLLHPIILRIPIALLAIWLGVLQEFILSVGGLQEIVLNVPRTNTILANKEGFASLLGYVSIHLLGLSTGTVLLPHTPSYFRKSQDAINECQRDGARPIPRFDLHMPRQHAKTVIELFSYSVVWWTLLGLACLRLDVSRRMANLPYILWTAAFNTSFILGYYLLDMFFFPTRTMRIKDPNDPSGKRLLVPQEIQDDQAIGLLAAINKNGLALFLLANLATGTINLSIKTMYTSDVRAMMILGGYALGLCIFAWMVRRIRLWRF